MVDYYCKICDFTINRKFKANHMKSKSHSHMNHIYVINKYVNGKVYWEDVEKAIHQYINENGSNFILLRLL